MNGFACNYPPHFTMETDIKYLRAEVERLNSEYNRYIKNSDEIINNAGDKIQELAAENNRLKAELALHQNSNKANSPIVSDRQILRINELETELAKKTEECESLYAADEQIQTMIKKIEDENEQLRECLKKYADLENWLYCNPCPGGKFQSIKWVGNDDPMVMSQKLLEEEQNE